jgi:hypothetical protein
MNQTEDDYLIYDADDEAITGLKQQNKSETNPFFIDKKNIQHLYKTITWK